MTGEFRETPEVEWERDERGFPTGFLRLLSRLVYRAASGQRYFCEPGFRTDLASVPKLVPGLVRLLFSGPLQTAWAAILHDSLYEAGRVPRRQADALFWEALLASGETPAGAWAMWLGVRVGGWRAWRAHARRRHRLPKL